MGSNATHNINVVVSQTGVDTVTSSLNNFANTSGTVIKSQDALSAAMGKTQGAAIKTGKEFTNVEKTEAKTNKQTMSLGQAFKDSALQIGAFASGIVSTIGQFINYQKAGATLEKQHALLNAKTITLTQKQAALKLQYDTGQISIEKYTTESKKLEERQKANAKTAEVLAAKDQMHSMELVNIATTVIPTVINGISSLSDIYKAVKGTADAASQGTKDLGESTEFLGTAADTATTTGLIPTGKSILQMIPGVDKLSKAIGLSKNDGLSGSLANNGAKLAEHNKFSTQFVNAFKDMGSAITNFASNIKKDMGSATGIIDKTKAGFGSFFTQLGSGFSALGGHLKTLGSAIVGFGKQLLGVFMANPILAAIALIGTAIVGLIFNVGGFRDRLNELGVTLGKMAPWAKPFLDALGWIGEKFAEVGDWIMGTDHLASSTAEAGAAAKKAAADFDTHFKAVEKSFIISKDFAKFEGIVQNLKNVAAEIAKVKETTITYGVTTKENLGVATTAFETFQSGIVKGVPEVDAKVKQIQATFEGMRLGTISLADGQVILGTQLGELESLLVDNVNTSKAKIQADKESAVAMKGTSDVMTEAEKIITDLNATTADSEATYKKFAIALTEKNYDIIQSMIDEGVEIDALLDRYNKEYPEGAKTVVVNGEKIVKSFQDINKEGATFATDITKMVKEAAENLTADLPPTLETIRQSIENMSKEEQLAADISKIATSGIAKDKQLLASAVAALAVKYGLTQSEADKALKDIQSETKNLVKEQDKANKKTDETIEKVQNLSQTRMKEQQAIAAETQGYQNLVKELEIETKVSGMTGKGLQDLVKIHDELANATGIAADEVGTWYAELEKSQKVEEETVAKLEELAERLGITIPDSIKERGIPAIKDYISEVTGIGPAAKKAADEAKKAFDDLRKTGSSALDGIISDKLGEDGDEIKKALKGIAKLGVDLDSFTAAERIIDIYLNDDNFKNDLNSLSETMISEFGRMEDFSHDAGIQIGDKFIGDMVAQIGSKSPQTAAAFNQLWTNIKASSAPTETGDVVLGKLYDALNKPEEIKKVMDLLSAAAISSASTGLDGLPQTFGEKITAAISGMQGRQDDFYGVGETMADGLYQGAADGSGRLLPKASNDMLQMLLPDPSKAKSGAAASGKAVPEGMAEAADGSGRILSSSSNNMLSQLLAAPFKEKAQEKGGEVPQGVADGMAAKKQVVQSAVLANVVDPITGEMTKVPVLMEKEITPVEGIFNSAFLAASGAAGTQLQGILTKVQTTMSNMSTSVATYSNSMAANFAKGLENMGIPLLPLGEAIYLLQGVLSTLSTSVATYSTSMAGNVTTFASQAIEQLTALNDYIISSLITTFELLLTTTGEVMTAMTTAIGAWITASIKSMGELIKVITATQKTFSTLSTSVKTYMTSMTTNIGGFAKASIKSLADTGKGATALQKALSDLSKNTATYTKSMEGNLKSFSKSAVSSLNAVAKAAAAAEKALKSMAAAAAKAKSAKSGLRFGGSFVTGSSMMNQSSFAQSGKSWINSKPRRIGGVNISEFSKPELVTVTPLSNPSDPMDKGLNYLDKLPGPKLQAPDLSGISKAGTGGGQQKGGPINVQLHTTITMPDGKVLAKAVQQHLLSGFSGIT